MFMHKSKKGFTIVELVIVIAVIAILAAVLIPTFSNLVKKANIASDTTLAKNINTALTSYNATNGVEEFADVIAAAREAGYIISNLNPTTEGCYFVWESQTNQILLVDSTDGYKVIYANNEDYADAGATWYFAVGTQAEADEITAALTGVNAKLAISSTATLNTELSNVTGEKTIYIDGGINVDAENTIVLNKADAKVTIDLGTSEVTGGANSSYSVSNVPFQVQAGELTLKGGIIKATGDALDADGEVMNNVLNVDDSTLNIEGAKIDAPNSTIAIALTNAQTTIKDSTIIGNDNVIQPSDGSIVTLNNCTVECEWLAIYSSNAGGTASEVTIKSGTYHANQTTLLGVYGGVIICEDGEYSSESPENRFFRFYNVSGGKIVLKGGTYNGVKFENLTKSMLEGWVDNRQTMPTIAKVDGAWVLSIN